MRLGGAVVGWIANPSYSAIARWKVCPTSEFRIPAGQDVQESIDDCRFPGTTDANQRTNTTAADVLPPIAKVIELRPMLPIASPV